MRVLASPIFVSKLRDLVSAEPVIKDLVQSLIKLGDKKALVYLGNPKFDSLETYQANNYSVFYTLSKDKEGALTVVFIDLFQLPLK